MKSLLEFNDRHPALTGLVGSVGSLAGALGAWYVDHHAAITEWAANVSAVGGALLFLGTVAVKAISFTRRHWSKSTWSRRWKRREPTDD